MNWRNRFKAWLKAQIELVRFALALDMRVLDDPVFLLGTPLDEKTLAMIADAKVLAGITE